MDAFNKGINTYVIDDLAGNIYGENGHKAWLLGARKVLGEGKVIKCREHDGNGLKIIYIEQ